MIHTFRGMPGSDGTMAAIRKGFYVRDVYIDAIMLLPRTSIKMNSNQVYYLMFAILVERASLPKLILGPGTKLVCPNSTGI